jgi:hypothetical protein
VKACVLRSHFEDVIAALGTEVDSKATSDDLTAVTSEVQVGICPIE